jgi:hypothetical protein
MGQFGGRGLVPDQETGERHEGCREKRQERCQTEHTAERMRPWGAS